MTVALRHVDLAIVGAGPAGAAAAIEAAGRGLQVVVVDKATFPRPKICGDGLTAGALRHLESLGLDPAQVPSWKRVDEVTLVSPSGVERRYRFPGDGGATAVTARREELDLALVELATKAGAEVLEGHRLDAVDPGARSTKPTVTVIGPNGVPINIKAEVVVAADGMWSPTRKLCGIDIGAYRGEWHAFRQYFTSVSDRARRDLIVWFEPDILPGYIWSFPLADGGVNVGFGIQRGGSHSIQDMKQLWPDILARPSLAVVLGPDAKPEGPHRAWPIPARLGELPLSHHRVVFVGDAAGATDPMTGEGIGQALETGRLIASSFARADGNPEIAIAAYERDLRVGMARDHAMARSLSAVLRSPRLTEWSLAITGANRWTRRNFGRWLFEDYPRATVINPSRWRPGLLRQKRAFPPPSVPKPLD